MKTALKFIIGSGIFCGLIALFFLVAGDTEAFFGTLVIALGLSGLGWAGRRIMRPDDRNNAPPGISLVIGVVFGGAGFIMIIGSALLFIDGEFGGGAGLFIFGLVFCTAAYGGAKVFAVPKGVRQIRVGAGSKMIPDLYGMRSQLTEERYAYIDENMPVEKISQMQQEWLDKPWTQRRDWSEGRVIQEGPGSIRLLIGFTLVWNLIAWGIAAFGLISEWDAPDVPWFIVVFPVAGILLAIMTYRVWLRRKRFGVSIFTLQTVPAEPGKWLRGSIHAGIKAKDLPACEFSLQLVCVRRSAYRDKDGDRRVSENVVWRTEKTVSGIFSADSGGFTVPVEFNIPRDQPQTELYPDDDRTVWRLEVSSKLKGIDFAAQFEIPVFIQT
jgi:hypothetical protein